MSTVPPDAIGARRLSQGITATWWYTVSGVMVFQVMTMFIWLTVFATMRLGSATLVVTGVGGILWCAMSIPLLLQYRHRDDTAGPLAGWRGIILPLAFSVVFGVLTGILSGVWMVAALAVIQPLVLLNWSRGVRMRLVFVCMVVLAGLWFIDLRTTIAGYDAPVGGTWFMLGVFAVMLPAMSVLSLWWWDVLIALDRARVAEARLGATQERLRVATDVHDLQGHHLQVIALQLELTERLLAKDPDAALEQLRLARTSVADAQQGTRDLALRFRGVPLPDEIANAVDLLRAAGTTAESTLTADAALAPATVLGPVIRETTTNALRHGGGRWARLSLARAEGSWRYEIVNDSASDSPDEGGGIGADGSGPDGSGIHGSGLAGIDRRVTEAGGAVHVERGKGEFHVIVTVPDAVTEPVVMDEPRLTGETGVQR